MFRGDSGTVTGQVVHRAPSTGFPARIPAQPQPRVEQSGDCYALWCVDQNGGEADQPRVAGTACACAYMERGPVMTGVEAQDCILMEAQAIAWWRKLQYGKPSRAELEEFGAWMATPARSEERRVAPEWVSTGRIWWVPDS